MKRDVLLMILRRLAELEFLVDQLLKEQDGVE